MPKKYAIISILIIVALAAIFVWKKVNLTSINQNGDAPAVIIPNPQVSIPTPADINDNNKNTSGSPSVSNQGFQPPLERAGERVTKKPFGIFITPQNSPVAPEKFRGYHTGTDFEIFPEELNLDVPIKAVCSGKLLMKKNATGYGGVAVQSCELDGQPITVVYGHLKLASVAANVGNNLNVGDTLGVLGAPYSTETSGERKHLHLSFHKGTAINILGYVQSNGELANWIDPCLQSCQ